jgi:hypothetical protein
MKTFTKQLIMICMMTTITNIGFAQCNSWLNVSSPNPIHLNWGAWSVATDQNNNVYSTGVFTGSISFGSNTLTNPTGGTSFYINKFNSGGILQWAIQLPVTTYNLPPIICQKNGILYVAGAFADAVVIGSNTITTLRGHHALFVMKLDLNGNIIGSTPEFGGLCNTLSYTLGITVNSLNEIYLTGRADGIFSFGLALLSNSEGSYTYLAKFNSDLSPIWAIQSNSMAADPRSRGWGITLDNNENVIIGGYFTQDIEFGTQSFNANNNTGGVNPYIAKFDNAGNCQWIRGGIGPQTPVNFGGVGPAYTVVSDNSGNIYYSASLDSTLVIDGNTLNAVNGVFYYCKYTPAGNLVWVHQAGNNSKVQQEVPTSLVIDGSDNMWSSGWIDGPASFGGYSLSHGGVFIAKLDLDGNFHGVIGGIGIAGNYSSALDTDGNLFVAGSGASDTISFDGNTIININDTSGVDFILKYCTTEMGIEQLSINDNQVSISPNPTTGKFTVTFPSTIKQIQISNCTGQVLQTKYVNNEKSMEFELTDNGIYLIQAKTDKQTLTKKVVICK